VSSVRTERPLDRSDPSRPRDQSPTVPRSDADDEPAIAQGATEEDDSMDWFVNLLLAEIASKG